MISTQNLFRTLFDPKFHTNRPDLQCREHWTWVRKPWKRSS